MSVHAQSAKPLFCVWDILGKSGDIYNLVIDQSLHMAKLGMPFELRAYTDERVAIEDYRAGQCAGVVAAGFRIRPFNGEVGGILPVGAAYPMIKDRNLVKAGPIGWQTHWSF